jgi:tetratricopeptide (TPR) repeat protein
MSRYGINWGESESDLTENDYDTIFTEASKIIAEKNTEVREIAIAFYSRGIIFRRRNDLQSAISDYTSAIELQNDYEPAWYNRGGVFYDLKMYDKALSDFNQALKLKPTDEDIQKWICFLKDLLEKN